MVPENLTCEEVILEISKINFCNLRYERPCHVHRASHLLSDIPVSLEVREHELPWLENNNRNVGYWSLGRRRLYFAL